MKSLAKMFFCCMSVIGMAALFSSCTDDNGTPDEPDVDFVGSSIKVPNEVGTYSVQMEFDHNWEVSNKTTWFSITPLSGTPGTATISVTVVDTNPDLIERVASFIIKNTDAGTNTQYYVIQDVTPGFNIADTIARVDETEQTYSFTVEGNVKYEAVPEVDWITINSITYDSTKLADDVTYSKYMTSRIELAIAANTSEVREGNILLTGENGLTQTITVGQWGTGMNADFSKDFFRRTFMYKCTADWCGPCGTFSNTIHQVEQDRPGRLMWAGFYQSCNTASLSAWSGALQYYYETRSTGIPTMVVNNYIMFAGAASAAVVNSIIDETLDSQTLKSNTVIGGIASLADGNIDLDLYIASKEAGEYALSVFILEDSLQYYQASQGNDYIHNNVCRGEMTEMWGDPLTLEANAVEQVSLSAAVPTIVEDESNLHLFAVVYRVVDEPYRGSVSGVNYVNYQNKIVDNVVNIPINGFAMFDYEN